MKSDVMELWNLQIEKIFEEIQKSSRKVFTQYDKIDRIYISVIIPAMIFDALFFYVNTL